MADRRSIELLAFIFASRTRAFRRLAQGLSRSLSSFSSFRRDNLDKVIKANQFTQYVDGIEIAANTTEQLLINLRETFKCIRKTGLKLTMDKCRFGATEINFLGQKITPTGLKPRKENVQNFLEKPIFQNRRRLSNDTLGSLITLEFTSQDYRKKYHPFSNCS